MWAAVFTSLLVAAAPAAETCQKNALFIFPAPGAVVPVNARFLLEGVGTGRAAVKDLLASPALLKSEQHTVPLVVRSTWNSSAGRTAVWLAPSSTLRADTEYRLVLPSSFAAVPADPAAPPLKWTTTGFSDTTAPLFRSPPGVSEGEYARDESGHERRFLRVRVDLDEDGAAWALVTLTRARIAAPPQVYPVPIVGNELRIGHDACSGGFWFEGAREYKIAFEVFDAAGNASKKTPALFSKAPSSSAQ